MELTCWIVCVVSSAKQSDSLPEQERDLRARAEAEGWKIDRVFADDSSGKHGPRRLIRHVVSQIRELPADERPDVLVMNRLDRVGRGRIVDSQVVLAELSDLGVRVWTREQGFVANETWVDELINAVRFAVARQENEVRGDRARAGRERRRQAGLHVNCNAAYGTVMVDGRPQAYEPEAAFVRDLFAKRAEGWGFDRLARHASNHAPPKRLKDGRTKKLRWGRSTFSRMMTCQTLRGLVVPEELFDRVAATLGAGTCWSATRQTTWPFPLRGALRCTCGAIMTTACTGRKGYRYRNYVCRHVERHGRYPGHRADAVEAQFVELLGRLRARPELLVAAEAQPDTALLRQELGDLRRESEAVENRRRIAWEAIEKGIITHEDLGERLREVKADRERITERSAQIRESLAHAARATSAAETLTALLADLEQLWPQAPIETQRQIAIAVADVVGGLWLDPEAKAQLVTGHDLAVDANRHLFENMREINTLRDAQMAQRKADDTITKKFIQSIGE